MSKIKTIGLHLLLIIVFFTVIKPAFIVVRNTEGIKNPEVGDFYIVNYKKFRKTQYSPEKDNKKEKIFEETFYTLMQIKSVSHGNVEFYYTGLAGNHFQSVKKWTIERYKEEEVFKQDKIIIIPQSNLSKLNYRGIIISVIKNP
jgi:hypothetical protein